MHEIRKASVLPLIPAWIAALVVLLVSLPAVAGSADDPQSPGDPEITDPVGDANFISPITGDERDTRPASLDNADLRVVWFETAYEIVDGEAQPTALLIHIQTEAPKHPTARDLRYLVAASLPDCDGDVEFQLRTNSGNPLLDRATMRATTAGCGNSSIVRSPVDPSHDGTVATISYPLDDTQISPFLRAGVIIDEPRSSVETVPVLSARLVIDDTAVGRSFTIGQDVPTDVDCAQVPESPGCQP